MGAVILMIGGICAPIAAFIAFEKGQNWFLAAIVGFFLGPIGLILVFTVSPNKKVLEKRALKSGESKRCRACAEVVNADASKCRYCGESL